MMARKWSRSQRMPRNNAPAAVASDSRPVTRRIYDERTPWFHTGAPGQRARLPSGGILRSYRPTRKLATCSARKRKAALLFGPESSRVTTASVPPAVECLRSTTTWLLSRLDGAPPRPSAVCTSRERGHCLGTARAAFLTKHDNAGRQPSWPFWGSRKPRGSRASLRPIR